MIVPGGKSEVFWGDGNWIFLDVGFSNQQRTCGLAFGKENPSVLSFGEVREQLVERIRICKGCTNLVVEAPLSVCFDIHGNPKGRKIERCNAQTRYWYVGAGCTVMTAALYLLRAVYDAKLKADLRLFEGFVSFKQRGNKSRHVQDVEMLRRIVERAEHSQDLIYSATELKIDEGDVLQSAFFVAGLDCGVPAVITAAKS